MKGCTHEWRWISDWYGDPGVINGTADCSRWECGLCGEVDENREPPSADDDPDYARERQQDRKENSHD